jgi:Mce-associated membrane protein
MSRRLAFVLLPLLSMALVLVGAWGKWNVDAHATGDTARASSLQVAGDTAVAMLTYTPDDAAPSLTAAADRLTGDVRDTYLSLIHDVVIPGAQQKRISATARVAASATVSATDHRSVVLLFVDQVITIDEAPPTTTASAVRVTLDNTGAGWVVSGFDPI